MVRAFIEDHMDGGNDPRQVRQAVKRIEKIALETRLAQIALSSCDIDVLAAIPMTSHSLDWNDVARIPTRMSRH